MNQKVLQTLEYNKILERLAAYASCEDTKKRCLSLAPVTDIDKINELQQTTTDALTRLYRSSGISFAGIHNINASLKRLDIGSSLHTPVLLRIYKIKKKKKKNKTK